MVSKSGSATSRRSFDATEPAPKKVNTLSIYDGRNAGVGRIVTGSTFHHYIDINLIGDTGVIVMATCVDESRQRRGEGPRLNDNPGPMFDDDQGSSTSTSPTGWRGRARPSA